MSSEISLLRVTLHLQTAWAVGGSPDGTNDVDLPVLVDPRGDQPVAYLPATTLVGALREHLADSAQEWLGPVIEDGDARTPSPIWALGTVLDGTHDLQAYGATAIDPSRGAAAAGTLRTAERAEPCVDSRISTATWYLQVERKVPQGLLEIIASWAPFIGRNRSVGMGRSRVSLVEALDLDLTEPADLTWWLTEREKWYDGSNSGLPNELRTESGSSRGPAYRLELPWRVVDALAVGSGEFADSRPSAASRSSAPRDIRSTKGHPIVPGSVWKGIFRHRAGFILRAIGADADLAGEVVARLFGPPQDRRGQDGGHRGVLRFSDSPINDAEGRVPAKRTRSHVGIDRISGGVQEGRLFAVNAIDAGAVMVGVIDADTPIPQAMERLLLWVTRDLHDGLVGVGGLTTRGYGTVELTDTSRIESLLRVTTAELQEALRLMDGLGNGDEDR